jgi:hypothetical protein
VPETLLVEGRTCWRRVHSDRASFLVDAEAYHSALAEAFERAERSIHLHGWDFDTRVRIRSDGQEPSRLGPVLRAAVDRNPDLEVRILAWDFAFIYAAERQPVPMLYVVPCATRASTSASAPRCPPGPRTTRRSRSSTIARVRPGAQVDPTVPLWNDH